MPIARIIVDPVAYDNIESTLSGSAPQLKVSMTFVVDFQSGIEANLNVIRIIRDGRPHSYIEAVLFDDDGCELLTLALKSSLTNEYIWEPEETYLTYFQVVFIKSDKPLNRVYRVELEALPGSEEACCDACKNIFDLDDVVLLGNEFICSPCRA